MTIPKLEQRHIEALEKTISFAQSMAYEKEHEDAFRLVTELPAILRAMQERDAELGADERRMNWIIDKCFQSGGGHGFTVFVPVDTECLRDGIDLAMNTATPPQAPAVPALGCGWQGRAFGASYEDGTCIDGYLWDLDSCDEPGGALRNGGDIPCPSCNKAEHEAYFTLDDDDEPQAPAVPAELIELIADAAGCLANGKVNRAYGKLTGWLEAQGVDPRRRQVTDFPVAPAPQQAAVSDAESIQRIIMTHCSGVMSMDRCRNLGIDIWGYVAERGSESLSPDIPDSAWPSEEAVERALTAVVCEGETVEWSITFGLANDAETTRKLMVREIVRTILATARTSSPGHGEDI